MSSRKANVTNLEKAEVVKELAYKRDNLRADDELVTHIVVNDEIQISLSEPCLLDWASANIEWGYWIEQWNEYWLNEKWKRWMNNGMSANIEWPLNENIEWTMEWVRTTRRLFFDLI